MPRSKKSTLQFELLPSGSGEVERQAVLDALRSNLSLLGELAARYQVEMQPERPEEMPRVNSPDDVYTILGQEMQNLAQEQLRVLVMDTSNQVTSQKIIYQGNINSAIVRPAEVLRGAVVESAPNIIIVHNHPSGNPEPSGADISITKDIYSAGKLLGIELLDHVVIGKGRWISLKEKDLFPK